MKHLILFISAFMMLSFMAKAQDSPMNEEQRLEVSVETPIGIDYEPASELLKSNIQQALILNGLSSTTGRFTTITKVVQISKDVTATAPAMIVTNLNITLLIGDLYTGTLFGQCEFEVKGIGETDSKSYMDAIRKVKARNPKLRSMIVKSKEKILSYFDANREQILNRIDAHITRKDYKSALIEIYSIPKASAELYNEAGERLSKIPAETISSTQINSSILDEYHFNGTRAERALIFNK